MNNNSWFKKEKPMLTLPGLGGGTASNLWKSGNNEGTYIDDIFSTYLYKGSGTTKTINNGIDLAGVGGMIWLKGRTSQTYDYGHGIHDTVRGKSKNLQTQRSNGQSEYPNAVTSFNSNGFSMGDVTYNGGTSEYASWTFRKEPGFFDVVTYGGTGSTAQNISHNLGSIPGMIIVKRTSSSGNWFVYHRSKGKDYTGMLDANNNFYTTTNWDNTEPTSTHFRVKNGDTNDASSTYVAYVFAGGASDEAGSARSVEFDGSGDYLKLGASSDFAFGTGDFTIECWVDFTDTSTDSNQNRRIFALDDSANAANNFQINIDNGYRVNGSLYFWSNSLQGYLDTDIRGSWHHIAVARQSGTLRIFLDGIEKYSASNTQDYSPNGGSPRPVIGSKGNDGGNYGNLNGKISNLRVVKGTAVYTSTFVPPTKGLTNITNTKLLCCNKNTVTGSTVTPSTITSYGNPQSSTYTPFDDLNGFKFGKNGNQNIVKCGSYKSSGDGTGHWINVELGWEPQFIIVKDVDSSEDWIMQDCMRGMPVNVGNHEFYLIPNEKDIEGSVGIAQWIQPTSTGFIATNAALVNMFNASREYSYIAIRRPDGYVGKPPELGTDVFAMDTGASSTTIPNFDSGFPVDYTFMKKPASSSSWYTYSRLTQKKELELNGTGAEGGAGSYTFDSNVGWGEGGDSSDWQSWMWKRHAGFDVVAYKGIGGKLSVPHSLGGVVEMIWTKERSNAGTEWKVFHKDRGPTNILRLNNSLAEETNQNQYQSTTPTETHFFVQSSLSTNNSNYLAMLFRSVDGISKVGSYNGSNSPQTITTGFQPRFFWCKRYNGNGNWTVFDTVRGWGSGNDSKFEFNTTGPTNSNSDFGYPTATGIYLTVDGDVNSNGSNFIYYAHA